MGAMKTTGEIRVEDRKAALGAVLESKEFARAPALVKLLKYLCEKSFEGRVHEIKEFSIATEVYGRSETFGERRDSVVRVEVSRLRKRLRNYYADEGSQQNLRIVIPAGTYQPEFEPQPVALSPATVTPPHLPNTSRRRFMVAALAGAAVLLAAVLLGVSSRDHSPKD